MFIPIWLLIVIGIILMVSPENNQNTIKRNREEYDELLRLKENMLEDSFPMPGGKIYKTYTTPQGTSFSKDVTDKIRDLDYKIKALATKI